METMELTATKQWDDIFMRDKLGDTGTYPTSGIASHSPDIIPYGTTPIQKPADLISDANWAKDLGKGVAYKQANYLYVRGQNLKNAAQTGDFYLYYCDANLLLYPDQWQHNALKTSDGKTSVKVSASGVGKKVVTDDPFSWVAPMPPAGSHFCLISRIVTPDHPAAIPQTGSIRDFATFICANPDFAWRNVVVQTAGAPTWTNSIKYDEGNLEAYIYLELICQHVPVGAQVAFSCGTPGPDPVIHLNKTTVTNDQSFITGMVTKIPENFKSNISYSYWSNGHQPLRGFNIMLMGSYLAPKSDEFLFSIGEDVRMPHAPHPDMEAVLAKIGPRKKIKVGAQTVVLG